MFHLKKNMMLWSRGFFDRSETANKQKTQSCEKGWKPSKKTSFWTQILLVETKAIQIPFRNYLIYNEPINGSMFMAPKQRCGPTVAGLVSFQPETNEPFLFTICKTRCETVPEYCLKIIFPQPWFWGKRFFRSSFAVVFKWLDFD